MITSEFIRARDYAHALLACELAPALAYHSLAHSRDDVVPAAERLAARSGVTGEDLMLLRTAAWYHDIGYIEQRTDHERVGAQIAGTVLPRFGYTASQIATIQSMIMATRMPQDPRTPLECIIVDADLDSLGRKDFMRTSLNLRAELMAFGTPTTIITWYGHQLQFLRRHHYFTAAARALRDIQKQRNIEDVHALLMRAQRAKALV
jgi:uncharacterized protein